MADTQSARSIAYSRAPFSTWLGIVCLFVLFGLIVLAVIGPSPRTSDYEETRAKKRMEKLKTLHEESQKELTVADLAQKKPAPAGPIATPAAQTVPAGASPAPAASPQAAAVSSPPAEAAAKAGPPSSGAASPPPATQQSPPAPASPAPATTP